MDRFLNAIACLQELKRKKPECQSEAELAIQMILGKRPGIEQKYEALLAKLDRTYCYLQDRIDRAKLLRNSALANERKYAELKISTLNAILADLQWMRARNRDMIVRNEKTAASHTGGTMPSGAGGNGSGCM